MTAHEASEIIIKNHDISMRQLELLCLSKIGKKANEGRRIALVELPHSDLYKDIEKYLISLGYGSERIIFIKDIIRITW